MPLTKLILFLKAPRLGFVKTRLARSIGEKATLKAYKSLAANQIERAQFFGDFEIHFTPEDAREEMEDWLGETAALIPQSVGDLGAKLSTSTKAAFEAGAERVLVIGADCPKLTHKHLEEAEKRLIEGADLIFGPCEDGGYYLIGMNAPQTELLKQTPWSQENTLEASLSYAAQAGLEVALLETLYDVDTINDWERALNEGFAFKAEKQS